MSVNNRIGRHLYDQFVPSTKNTMEKKSFANRFSSAFSDVYKFINSNITTATLAHLYNKFTNNDKLLIPDPEEVKFPSKFGASNLLNELEEDNHEDSSFYKKIVHEKSYNVEPGDTVDLSKFLKQHLKNFVNDVTHETPWDLHYYAKAWLLTEKAMQSHYPPEGTSEPPNPIDYMIPAMLMLCSDMQKIATVVDRLKLTSSYYQQCLFLASTGKLLAHGVSRPIFHAVDYFTRRRTPIRPNNSTTPTKSTSPKSITSRIFGMFKRKGGAKNRARNRRSTKGNSNPLKRSGRLSRGRSQR